MSKKRLTNLQTPGVYIQEQSSFPNSIVNASTNTTAFIGYTEQAKKNGKDAFFEAIPVYSIQEFEDHFLSKEVLYLKKKAATKRPVYFIQEATAASSNGDVYSFQGTDYTIEPDPSTVYYLHLGIRLFFANGGQIAYVVSVGTYGEATGKPILPGDQIVNPNVKRADLTKGLEAVKDLPDISLYSIPDAVLLSGAENGLLMNNMLLQSANNQSTFSIFDVIGGDIPNPAGWETDIENFRTNLGNDHLKWGAAYFPFLETNIVQLEELEESQVNNGNLKVLQKMFASDHVATSLLKKMVEDQKRKENHQALIQKSENYNALFSILLQKINTLPPGPALAGIYARVDHQEGVWKAPANVQVAATSSLTIAISDAQQAGLNVDPNAGKSINAIRVFQGRGVLVWGARTLAGNNIDWRYVPVRRFMTMIEQSCKVGIKSFVFAPNDVNTWSAVKAALENYLTNLWQEGALQGARRKDAFAVRIGLGETMTATDILENRMIVSILVAVARPAEFIEISFVQQMAT